jgi:undecaprenyl diphosphate synthase
MTDTTTQPHSPDTIDRSRLPAHVGIIMDGNGRWAGQRGEPRRAGHAAGELALFDTVEGALELGLSHLTVWAFSTDNWKRPADEVRFLMDFNRDLLRRRLDELDERQVRVRFVGRRSRPVPKRVVAEIDTAEARTARHRRLTLQIAFNYGGRAELADAARRLADDVAAGRLDPRKVTEQSIHSRLYQPDAPDVDLLIRTSGEQRLSNFLLWEAAYAELWFTPVLWPDFRRQHLFDAVGDYQSRERRFGKV